MGQLELIFSRDLDFYIKKHPDALLLDVRQEKEYQKCHIKHAVNMPYEEEMEWNLDRRRVIIVYCERGSASIQAARALRDEGYHVVSVIGGIREYRGRNLVFFEES